MHEDPYIIWAALLGASFTLIGVIVSNWFSGRQLRRQLRHDSEEKQKERLNSLRKEVYLTAAEEMAKVNGYLGKLPQLDPTKKDMDAGMSGFLAASSKLQLVCEPKTAIIASELTTHYGEVFMRLLAKAYPIQNIASSIRICTGFYESNQAEAQRALAEMQQLNESGKPDPLRFEALNASYEFSQQEANKLSHQRSELHERHNNSLREYTMSVLEEVRAVAPLQAKLTAAAREELHLGTDVAEFEARLKAGLERMDKAVQELLKSLENG